MTPPQISEADRDHTTLYTAGLRLTGERPLTEAERNRLGIRVRNRYIIGSAGMGSVPLVIVIAFAAAAQIPSAALPMTVMTLLSIRMAANGLHSLRAAAKLRRDLSAGYLEIYAVSAEEGRPEWVGERLPISGMVWSVNGEEQKGEQIIAANRVADAPEFAQTAAQWLSPQPTHTSTGESGAQISWQSNRRPAAPAEQKEIGKHATTIVWANPTGVFLLLEVMIFSIMAMEANSRPSRPAVFLIMLLIAIGVAFGFRNVFQRLRLAGQMLKDRVFGEFLILKATPQLGAPEDSTPVLELMPNSQLVWTINGQPAPWRTGVGT